MAESISKAHESRKDQISAAFTRTLGRLPSTDELAEVDRFLNEASGTATERLTHLCLSLFNSNEFVVID